MIRFSKNVTTQTAAIAATDNNKIGANTPAPSSCVIILLLKYQQEDDDTA